MMKKILSTAIMSAVILTTSWTVARAAEAVRYNDYAVGSAGRFTDEINENYAEAVRRMSQEFLITIKQIPLIIGQFFDAEIQMDTHRTYQRLNAEASKDYQPSQMMCQYGTFIRSVALAEEKTHFNRKVINQMLMETYTNQEHTMPSKGIDADYTSRISTFITTYCDPQDNMTGLKAMCSHGTDKVGAADPERINKDINFAKTFNMPLTLDVDYDDDASSVDEEDLYALARNLYWAQSLPIMNDEAAIIYNPTEFANARRLTAMQSVAHNSYTHQVAEKSRTETGIGEKSGWNYMKALMKDFGVSDEEIHADLGDFPSYYAQMEVLTKKMYQDPSFYTNLYDKPANVARIDASMEAIGLMQDRDAYKVSLRREMLLSMMLEQEIAQQAKNIPASF